MTSLEQSRGFSLIEVLIAVLILSFGLLGLAGLQTNSVQQNQSAADSSQATFLAADALDRMRANRGNALAYAITIQQNPQGTVPGATTRAQDDLIAWKRNIDNSLTGARDNPDLGGSITVTRNPGTDDSFAVVVTLRWISARGEQGDARIRQFIVRTEI